MNLEPAYDILQKAILQVDNQHAIFFEGVTWDFFEVGFSKVPGGAEYQNRSVLSYRYYQPPDFKNFAARMQDLTRLKCGGFLTELLAVGTSDKFKNMFEILDLADQCKQIWHGWKYKHYPDKNNNGSSDVLVQNISCTYPQAVAGNIQNYYFN